MFLGKKKRNALISKGLSNSYINHDKFVSVNNLLREYNEMKEEIKNPKYVVEHTYKNNGSILCQL